MVNLLEFGPFEAVILGEGPVVLGGRVVDGGLEDIFRFHAGEEL